MTITINGTTGIAGVDGSASTPAVQGADTDTGIFFPAADTIAFAEGGTEVMRLDSSANLQFNSGYGSVATAYGCRAWVNFNGTTNTGGFCTIRASGNVTSVADNGTGDYTVNFTTAMPDAKYSAISTGGTDSSGTRGRLAFIDDFNTTPTSSLVRLKYISHDGTFGDPVNVCVAIFR
jgi:hypothetical protein